MPGQSIQTLETIKIGRALIGLCATEGVDCTVLVLHEDVGTLRHALVALCHLASTIITVKPLTTGTSAEIEAQMDIFRRKCVPSSWWADGRVARLGYSEHSVPR